MAQTTDEKYHLITRNLQEVVGDENLIKKIITARPLKIYWGTAPTGKIHLGYLVPMLKILDYLNAGCEVTVLIADLHALLDNLKSNEKLIEFRSEYYQIMIKTILESLGANISKINFVKGSSFQLSEKYTRDMYKAHSLITTHDAKRAGAEVVKQSDNPKMTGLLYPTLQALDEQYLNCDVQSGGLDQRKIFMHAKLILPLLGYKKKMHFMNELVPGLRFSKKNKDTSEIDKKKLFTDTVQQIKSVMSHCEDNETPDEEIIKKITGILEQTKNNTDIDIDKLEELEKMSASNEDTKIDLLDSSNQIKKKINRAYCFPGDILDNSLMVLLEKIIFPVLNIKKNSFDITRSDVHGGNVSYNCINDVKNDFKDEKLHPSDFKSAIITSLNIILEPIRIHFCDKALVKLVNNAYPLNK